MGREEFSRTELLLGPRAIDYLSRCKVAVFGLGGVGSYVAEALARCGVGAFVLIDSDVVTLSNINRQLLALHSTVGRPKVLVMRERILDINPEARIETLQQFVQPGDAARILQPDWDYVIDAIDTVRAKVDLAVAAAALRLPMISCMGAGNKLDPTRFEVTDLARTRVCPLSRVMRRELKKHGILHLKVVYSPEEPVQALTPAEADPLADVVGEDDVSQGASFVRRVPGSIAYVPSVAGLILAGEVIRDLLQAAASDSPSGPGDGAGSDR